MRTPRFIAVAIAPLLAALLALLGAAPAHSAGPRYVALGDSYSAGLGAGSYDAASGACKRSTKAYPALWAAAHAPSAFDFTACSGATTTDVTDSQLGPVDAATGLVSVTVGGNDAEFSDVMTTCVLSSQAACLDRVATARTFIDGTLPGLLDHTYDAIRAKGPHAHVVVLGYPRVYQVPGDCVLGLSDASRKAIDAAADDLDDVLAKRAADHGFTFADVRSAFSAHELCSPSPWLHSVTLPVDESYHPTATGQSHGYLLPFTGAA
ncbi:SGNH/GDSL hydrolase family protein [Streptomyces sp. V4-01]|uniref:SGNH/GDSL hydrolase family protein n=1 Tax=Actinacidiphila polyblastidii TaxID=3110430 RepID=A0ABU7PII2_9ACTN|nr:SGNH/GDSL hydrolase family protein [Streptomyces sp. V4-01]